MKKNKNNKVLNKKLLFSISLVIMLLGAVVLPILLKSFTSVQYKGIYAEHKAGEIAEANVYAKSSIDLIDENATIEKEETLKKSILPIFTYSRKITLDVLAKADSLRIAISSGDFSTLSSILGYEKANNLATSLRTVTDTSFLSLIYDLVLDIMEIGYYNSNELISVKEEGYSAITLSNRYDGSVFEKSLELNNVIITTDTIDSYLASLLNSYAPNITSSEIVIIYDLVLDLVQPNVFYDQQLTQARILKVTNSMDPVVISIEKGDLLIEANHVITNKQVEVLRLLTLQSTNTSFFEIISNILFNLIWIGTALYVFMLFAGKRNNHLSQYVILLVSGYILTLIIAYPLIVNSSYLNLEFTDSYLPFFFLPLLLTMLTGYKRMGFVSVFLISGVYSTVPTANIMTFFYCVVCGSASIFFVNFLNRRIEMIYQWFFSTLGCAGVTILFMIINQVTFTNVFLILLGEIINITFAYIMLSITVPIVERIMNLPTDFRLEELAYGENPLLHKLAQAAPGTYRHSQSVADLAEAGARAIGANPYLAKVGGLYHDIGKIEHPEYFVENQTGVNKHDDISPSLSVAVIKSHVKVGAEKGREAGLPYEVIQIIGSHHGNDVIQYFYHEALNSQAASNSNKGETVNASDYAYNAELPDFPECGIVMLADSIEAASRTVTPNAGRYEKLIDSIFMGKIERGQLNNCNLTLNDIDALKDAFVKTLVAKNHSRIEYPEDDD
ncbi:MAG: HDIG domain-containing protein [Sphaerochaetaceae bacterium]|nr:HDIG domain-containing protein [Sphaerochaetaceae bacterium]